MKRSQIKTLKFAVGLVFVLSAMVGATSSQAQIVSNVTIKVPYQNGNYVGKPLAWDGNDMMLLRRDGKINILPVTSESDFVTVSNDFQPDSAEAIRERLQREFGSKYQVSITRNFVVVHPPGDYQVWALPFEKLYNRFQIYFNSRHFQLEAPEFPMVAVVLRTRNEFDKFLTAYHFYDQRILGYYSPKSNRIITYDQSDGNPRDQSWFFNADTIIHEATHQTAFNTGIHSRFAPVPRWVSEGLAMLFEAPGVNNSMHHTKLADRINQSRLAELRLLYRQDKVAGKIAELITSDDLFRTDPSASYAVSWGLTFYLSEKMPTKYQQFLKADGARKDFAGYSDSERANDFADVFGSKLSDIEANMKRFIEGL